MQFGRIKHEPRNTAIAIVEEIDYRGQILFENYEALRCEDAHATLQVFYQLVVGQIADAPARFRELVLVHYVATRE